VNVPLPADLEWRRAEAFLAEAAAQEPSAVPMSMANAAYYAAFHAALAVLLLENETPPKKHETVIQRFGLKVKDSKPPLLEAGRNLSKLKRLRVRASYETQTRVSAAEAATARALADDFLRLVGREFGFPRVSSDDNG
jgi:uncharacterized protein (UPF0332 family)